MCALCDWFDVIVCVEFYIFCEVPHQAVAALAGIVIILILLALGLLGHLFLFHLYLSE